MWRETNISLNNIAWRQAIDQIFQWRPFYAQCCCWMVSAFETLFHINSRCHRSLSLTHTKEQKRFFSVGRTSKAEAALTLQKIWRKIQPFWKRVVWVHFLLPRLTVHLLLKSGRGKQLPEETPFSGGLSLGVLSVLLTGFVNHFSLLLCKESLRMQIYF